MASGFKILMPNDKDGLSSDGFFTCDMDNKIACLFKISRSQLERWKDRPEMKCSGVYLLLGAPEDEDKPVVYVGQAGFRNDGTTIYSRLQEHTNDYTKEYWSEAVFFYSKEDSLEFNHISYLENRFYNLVKSANRYAVKNKKEPNRGNISEQNKVAMDNYIEDVKAMMEVIGYKVFTPLVERKSKNAPVAVSNGDVEVFLERKVGGKFKAQGHAVWNSQGFVVLKGSVLSPNVTSAVSANVAQKRKQAKIVDNVLMEDVCFTSPSGAASFVVGNASNGWVEWKDRDGVILDKIKDSASRAQSAGAQQTTAKTETGVQAGPGEDKKIEVVLNQKIKAIGRTVKARGVYDAETKRLTVLAGSEVSPVLSDSVKSVVEGDRKKAKIEDGVLKEDMTFSSSSRAAKFVTGNSCNGLVVWTCEDGVTLDKLG